MSLSDFFQNPLAPNPMVYPRPGPAAEPSNCGLVALAPFPCLVPMFY